MSTSKYISTNLVGNRVSDLIEALKGLDQDATHNVTQVGVQEGGLYIIFRNQAGMSIIHKEHQQLKFEDDSPRTKSS